ncbi:MAG: insulinase family protein [Alphaproteobacteria bacterium]|nr:insulinase family protein [Alphaproteobacteria bacterium]
MSVRIDTLAGGLRVASDRMDQVETVSVGLYVGAGTRHEPAAINGAAHMLEHMAFKGTKRRDAKAIAEEIENVGAFMNAHTGREQTAYYIKCLKEDVDLALDILADIFLESVFDPAEFERERGVILQELGQVEDTPDDVIFDRFQETAYPDQALGRPVLGTAENIRHMPRAAALDWRNAMYAPGNVVLAAAGNLDPQHLLARAGELFGKWRATSAASDEPAVYRGGEFRDDSELEQAHLVLGFPGIAYRDPDYWAVQVFATMLGGGMSSRLFQEIREKRGLCYSISAHASSFADGGVFDIYTGTGEREMEELVPALVSELRGARAVPTPAEVRRAKAQMRAGLLMSLESTNARMDALGGNLLVFGRDITPEEVSAKVEAVTADDIARVAARILSGTPTLAALGPLGKLVPLSEIVAKIAA